MSGLKLTMATTTSIYGNPYKFVRTLATNNPAFSLSLSSTTTTYIHSLSSFTLIRTDTKKTNQSYAPRPLAYCRIHPRSTNVGFRFRCRLHNSSPNPPPKSRSEDRGGERAPSSSAIGGEKMGSVDNKDDGGRQQAPLPPQQGSHKQQQQHHQQSTKLLTLPTILTLGRIAAVPLLVSTFYVNSWWGTTTTTSIFIAAAITDWLDGYIARKMRLGTAFGAFLDPVADKLMVAATLILLCTGPLNVMFGDVPWLLTVPSIAIIGREITMSAVREWAASQNAKLLEAVAVNSLGKWKTASQMIALTILLATRDNSLAGSGVLVASGVVLLYISAGLAVWSLAVYMRKIWTVLLK